MEFLTSGRFNWNRSTSPASITLASEVKTRRKLPVVSIREWGEDDVWLCEHYNPMDNPRLWREFAAIGEEVTEVERDRRIIEFATRYGLLVGGAQAAEIYLGVDLAYPLEEYSPRKLRKLKFEEWPYFIAPPGHQTPQYQSEPRKFWLSQAKALQELSRLWFAIQGSDATKLENAYEAYARYYEGVTGQGVFGPDARYYAIEHLTVGVSRQLRLLSVEAGLSASRYETRDRADFDLQPGTLIGCIWTQFAMAVGRNQQFAECEYCGKFFEVGSNLTARSDKRFCTNTCKANAHRKLKEEIRRLHGEGVSVREIAKRTGKDVAKIKEWTK
jgi:hypothetical protein